MASATPIIEIPSSILLATLATWPLPLSPQCTMFLPMALRIGCTKSNSAWLPPTIKVRVPAAAPVVPPETGASIIEWPAACAALATSRALWGSMVEQSIRCVALASWANSPSLPKYTLFTWAAAGSIVINTSGAAWAKAWGEVKAIAPSATTESIAAWDKSKTDNWWPALIRLAAIGPPMLPSPKNPICMMSSAVIYYCWTSKRTSVAVALLCSDRHNRAS